MKTRMIFTAAFMMCVGLGIGQGFQPVAGFNYGAKQYDRVRQTIKTAAKASVVISVVWFFIFQFGGGFLASLFVEDEPLYQEFAVHCFRLYMAGFLHIPTNIAGTNKLPPRRGILLECTFRSSGTSYSPLFLQNFNSQGIAMQVKSKLARSAINGKI